MVWGWRPRAGLWVGLCPAELLAPQEVELITKFLPTLMSFVVDDHAFNVDQKLPAEERAPAAYPSALPESFTRYCWGVGRAGRGPWRLV